MNRNKKNLAVGDLIRKNAYVMEKGKKKYLKVSPSAVNEYNERIKCNIEINWPQIAEIADRDKRSTIMVKYKETKDDGLEPVYNDVVLFLGRIDSKIASGTHEYCTRCLRKIEKETQT